MADLSQVKEITEKLESGVKELFTSDKYADYLKTMSRFHHYSTRNVLLIHMQMPEATILAGYQAWKNKFKRQVKKGEHGIKIFAPVPFVIKEEHEKLDPDTRRPVLDENGMAVIEEHEKHLARFKVTTIFDVSQTDGEPLPALAENLTGDVRYYELFMDTLRAVLPLPIVFEHMVDMDGVCRFGDSIAIREGMSEIQTVSATIHEITHARLHDIDVIRLADENAEPKSHRTEEIEAESVSYSICQYYGIETGANSIGYVAEWSRSRELKELNASLDTIRKTAAELIDNIDEKYLALAKERGIDLSADVPVNERVEETPALSEHALATNSAGLPEPDKQYDLGYGFLGNGITVWNRAEEVNGDYATVAHIAPNRDVAIFDKEMPDNIRKSIEAVAQSPDTWAFGFKSLPGMSTPEVETPEDAESDVPFPDPAIGYSEMNLYGYTQSDMFPLTADRAIELFDANLPIYLLYPDNTEALAFDRDEIITFGGEGLCGITHADWEVSPILAAQKAIAENSEGSREADLLYGNDNKFGIYQIRDGIDEARNFRFAAMHEMEALGLTADRNNYELVYTAPLTIRDTQTNLHRIFKEFNDDERPADFTGRSVSVSDVIVLQWRGDVSSHYVDSVGFAELPGFLGEETMHGQTQAQFQDKAVDAAPTLSQLGKRSEQPKVNAGQTVAQIEADVKAGKVISLLDLSRAQHSERKPEAGHQTPTAKTKPSLLGRLEHNKQKAARPGQPDIRANKDREV